MARVCGSRCVTAGPGGTARPHVRSARRQGRDRCRCDGAGARRRELAAARLGRRMGRDTHARGRERYAARGGELRLHRRLVRHFRDRFEGSRSSASRLTFGGRTVRGEAIVTRTGIEGGAVYALSAELREAIEQRARRRCTSRCGPISTSKELTATAVGAERQTVACRISCARPFSLSPGRDRIAAGGGQDIRHSARVAVAGRSCQPDQRRPDRTHRRRADRARDLDRGRDRALANSMPIS